MKKHSIKLLAFLFLALAVLVGVLQPHTKNYATSVVLKKSFLAQTSGTSLTTLYTPGTDESSDYRVSTYVTNPSQSGTSVSVGVYIYWTDENGAGNFSCPQIATLMTSASNATDGSATCVLHLGSGHSITYQLTVSGGAPSYDAFITVEEL